MNSKGFTLVETMIAVGMVGAIALGLMKLMGGVGGQQKLVQIEVDEINLLREFQSIISSEKFCRISLVGNGAPGSPDAPLEFNKSEIDDQSAGQILNVELWYANAQGTERTQKRFSAADRTKKRFGVLTIDAIEFAMDNEVIGDYPDSLDHYDIGHIHLQYSYMNPKSKKETKKLKFPVFARMTTQAGFTTLHSCGDRESDLIGIGSGPVVNDYDVISKEVCERMFNHTWDPTDTVCYPQQLSNFDRIVVFKTKLTSVGWTPPSHKVVHTNEKSDYTASMTFLSPPVDVYSNLKKWVFHIGFNGYEIDSKDILSIQLINNNITPMKVTLQTVDDSNRVEVLKSDDSTDNPFEYGDELIFIFASPRM